MGLRVGFVETLEQVVDPVIAHLTSNIDRIDLFETEHIVVPNAGVRAWLLQQLAHKMGSTGGLTNGAVGNLNIGFVGLLDRFVMPDRSREDPWDVDRLTFAVLQAMTQLAGEAEVVANVMRLGGGLKAARVLADRFDRYHARRPHMIRCWEAGRAELSPFIGEEHVLTEDGLTEAMLVVPALTVADQWQFTLWREVRTLIGVPSPPARSADALKNLRENPAGFDIPERLAVVGLQSVSARHLEVLRALGSVCEVMVLMVHPSPELADHWTHRFSGHPVAPGIAVARPVFTAVPDTYDPLVYSWLRGSMDLQNVLRVNDLAPAVHGPARDNDGDHLLAHVQRAVARPSAIESHEIAKDDQSFLIHRAHNLARQVEVLHDALLHAFDQLPDLQPHEVVVVSPVIDKVAPLLQATFQREVTTKSGKTFRLPIVVADRGLREVDEGSRLLADLMVLLRSRFGISDVMAVITSPLVLRRFGLGPDDVDTWSRYIDRARVRWGIDDHHRADAWKVNLGDEGMAHTWALAIRRSLLGAVLPDAVTPSIELGGVVPLIDVEPNEIRAITTLAEIMQILSDMQRAINGQRPVGEWCAIIESTLSALADDASGELDEALRAVAAFGRNSSLSVADGRLDVAAPVEFAHLSALITEQVTSAPGRQPLRTGAITATSMIPLRSVPFRVVCVVGFDDGALSAGDSEGDDLESRQSLIGDSDPRLDQRRMLLDAITAASDRVIVTCVGRNVKNNEMTQLVTPLAELVDMCRTLGVGKNLQSAEFKDLSAIEVVHPRHFNSPANFIKGQIIEGLVWSHSTTSLTAARVRGQDPSPARAAPMVVEPLQVVPLESLEQLMQDPLRLFLRGTLAINTWRENREDEPAIIPLSISKSESKRLAASLFDALGRGESLESWEAAAVAGGEVPPGVYRHNQLAAITGFVQSLRSALGTWSSVAVEDVDVSLPLAGGRVLRGRIPGVHTRDDGSAFVMRVGFDSRFVDLRSVLPLHMVVLAAAGRSVTDGPCITRHDKEDSKASTRNIRPVSLLDQADCLDRLATLADLSETARSMPCPSFDGAGVEAAIDRVVAEATFQKRVNDRYFRASDEALVYGYAPQFDEVFPTDSAVIDFWSRLAATLLPAADSKRYEPSGWRKYEFS